MSFSNIESKWRLIRKRIVYRARLFRNYLFRKADKEPLFVLAARRTGSNLLLSYLNSIPGVSLVPEALNDSMFYGIRKNGISKKATLHHLKYSLYASPGVIGGTKINRVQMIAHGLRAADLRRAFSQARFLILYRGSLLEQYLSLKIAEKTGEWVFQKEQPQSPKIRVEVDDFLDFSGKIRAFYEEVLSDLSGSDRVALLRYEDLAAEPQKLFNEKIFPLMGLSAMPVSSSMRKQNIRTPEEMVENYPQIRDLDQKLNLSFQAIPAALERSI